MNNSFVNCNTKTAPAPTLNIPFPGQDKDPAGNSFYWRYVHQIDEDGIHVAAAQYVIIHETPCYVTLAPAHLTCLAFNGKANYTELFADEVERLYKQYKPGGPGGWMRRKIRRIRKDTGVFSYAHRERSDALKAMMARWMLRQKKLREAMAICDTIVMGVSYMDTYELTPYSKNLGHNEVTEEYVWY